MSAPRRSLLVLVAAGVLAALLLVRGQAAAPPKKPKAHALGADLLVPEEGAQARLEAAMDYIQTEDWQAAITVLQALLSRADVLAPLSRRDDAGTKRTSWVGAHAEALRLLSTLPETGRQVYEVKFGPKAAALLAEGRKGDAGKLADVVRYYLYTDSGPEALAALARLYDKRGDYLRAARAYALLLRHRGPARWTPDELYRAAIAFRNAGDQAGVDRVARLLLTRVGAGKLHLGTRTLDRARLRKELAAQEQADSWPVFRRDAARSNSGRGGIPFLKPSWQESAFYPEGGDEARRWIEYAKKKLHERKQPLLTSFFPISATGRNVKTGREYPLVIFRSYWGLHAVRTEEGKLSWEQPSRWSIARMFKADDERETKAIEQWLGHYLNKGKRSGIVFENSVVGTLSSDRTFVYAVEDLAVPPPEPMHDMDGRLSEEDPYRKFGPNVAAAIQMNKLLAYQLSGQGKLAWELGGPDDKTSGLEDSYFLGAPLPVGGKLYVLTEKQQELRLVCIDPTKTVKIDDIVYYKPRVLSVVPLAQTRKKLSEDLWRRIQAAPLAYAGGVLVVPTNAGALFGVDVLSNDILWAFPYRGGDLAPPGGRAREHRVPQKKPPRLTDKNPPFGIYGQDGFRIPSPSHDKPTPAAVKSALPKKRPDEGWRTSAPSLIDGKIVFAPPDADALYCLDHCDGSLLWAKERRDDDLYLAGVFRGKVVVVGTNRTRGLSLATGETLWELPTGEPSGQGVASGRFYFLPLAAGAIGVLDVDRGIIHARVRPRVTGPDQPPEVLGNLLFFQGRLFSQTPDGLVAYPLLRELLGRIDERLTKAPPDADALIERADLRRQNGDLAGAIADLVQARKADPGRKQIRNLLFEVLTEALRRDFPGAENYLKDYEGLVPAAPDETDADAKAEAVGRRATYLVVLGQGREAQGRLVEALRAYLELAGLGRGGEMLPLPDDPSVRARRDVWARSRIDHLLKNVTPARRKELEAEIEKQRKALFAR